MALKCSLTPIAVLNRKQYSIATSPSVKKKVLQKSKQTNINKFLKTKIVFNVFLRPRGLIVIAMEHICPLDLPTMHPYNKVVCIA